MWVGTRANSVEVFFSSPFGHYEAPSLQRRFARPESLTILDTVGMLTFSWHSREHDIS